MLLGKSWGGRNAVAYAAARPNKVRKLVLFAPAYGMEDEHIETLSKLSISVWLGWCEDDAMIPYSTHSVYNEHVRSLTFESYTSGGHLIAPEASIAIAKFLGLKIKQPKPEIPVDEQGPEFIAAETFEGVKSGYVFTTRSQGTGYYRCQLCTQLASVEPTLPAIKLSNDTLTMLKDHSAEKKYLCDHNCGFSGAYNAVADHEPTCAAAAAEGAAAESQAATVPIQSVSGAAGESQAATVPMKKSAAPRAHSDWDKFDVDGELERYSHWFTLTVSLFTSRQTQTTLI